VLCQPTSKQRRRLCILVTLFLHHYTIWHILPALAVHIQWRPEVDIYVPRFPPTGGGLLSMALRVSSSFGEI